MFLLKPRKRFELDAVCCVESIQYFVCFRARQCNRVVLFKRVFHSAVVVFSKSFHSFRSASLTVLTFKRSMSRICK